MASGISKSSNGNHQPSAADCSTARISAFAPQRRQLMGGNRSPSTIRMSIHAGVAP